jgi:hypothetical protein
MNGHLGAHAPPPRVPKIEIRKLEDDYVEFVLEGTDVSMANALRRIMIAEVCGVADSLKRYSTTVLHRSAGSCSQSSSWGCVNQQGGVTHTLHAAAVCGAVVCCLSHVLCRCPR